MDANATQAIMAISKAWRLRQAVDTGLVPGKAAAHGTSNLHCPTYDPNTSANSGAAPLHATRQHLSSFNSGNTAPLDATRQHHNLLHSGNTAPLSGSSASTGEEIAPQAPTSILLTACNQPQCEYQHAVGLAAALLDLQDTGSEQAADIWSDQPVLQLLKDSSQPAGQLGKVDKRIRRRASAYYFSGDKLIRRFPDNTTRVVPAPADRAGIIRDLHQRMGHYGIRRTAALLRTQYWWHGFWADVVKVVSACEHCQRVNASFTAKPQQLTPIPISSAGFRWHVDTAGPLPKTDNGNKYVLVAVEAFTKYLVAVPMKDKESSTTAYHFLHNVISRFGAPGQVVTDGGGEFDKSFTQLCSDCMIDHAHISTDHPQANGQAEKGVHIVKRALTKMSAAKHSVKQWDRDTAWVVLGYNCSPQQSTGVSPYELMYARPPVIPPAVQASLSEPINHDDPAAAEADLLLRKKKVAEMTPMALQNLTIAQHRDQLRYLKVRAPDYTPKKHHFRPGQFVYLQQLQRYSTLQPRAQPVIYQVLEVRDSGVLKLQGKCGRTIDVHMSHLAPCHLPDIDPTIDPRLVEDIEAVVCEVCGTDENAGTLLICDICVQGYHTYCLHPPLDELPADEFWLCPACTKEGYTAEDAASRALEREALEQQAAQPNIYPNASMKRRDEEARQLDGRLIQQPFRDPSTKRKRLYWGKLHFRGELSRPKYFHAVYEDGDSHYLSLATAKKFLAPADAQLPAGIQLPTPTAQVATKSEFYNSQAYFQEQQTGQQLFPSTSVPNVEFQLLSRYAQLSLAQHLADPITANPQWQLIAGKRAFTVHLPLPHAATALCMSPRLSCLLPALHRAILLKPAVIVCYAPSIVLPPVVQQLLQALKDQGLASAVRSFLGWWIIISRAPLKVQAWLQVDL